MRYSTFAVAALVATTAGAHDVPSLTPENYDSLTQGKTVFIKFFAPWVSAPNRSFKMTLVSEMTAFVLTVLFELL